jgi:hypothetical protein
LIDFRYHLVSIVSVFLALAIGIIIGAFALQPDLAKTLDKATAAEAKANAALYAHNGQLNDEIAADQAFGQAAEGSLLRGLLTGQQVVLVVAPGADSPTVDGITTALQKSGAAVTGQVVLSQQFFDTGSANEQALNNTARTTAASFAPLGVALPNATPAPQVSGQQAAARLIAAAIVNKDGLATVTAKASQQVLTGFANAGFLAVKGAGGNATLAGQATMAVVVLPATVPPAKTSGPFNLALVSLAQDLQEASKGAVLAGSIKGSGSRSAIDSVVSGSAGVTLMTVDNAETVIGQIIVAQALNQLLTGSAKPTGYGVGQQTVPSPAPSASPTPSASSSPTSKKTRR